MNKGQTVPLLWRRYHDQHSFRVFLGLYKGYFWKLVWMFIMFTLKYSPTFILPILTADIINNITDKPPAEALSSLPGQFLFGLIIVLQNIPTHTAYARALSEVNRDVECRLRSALCTRLQQLTINFLHAHKVGSLQSKILRDVENVEQLAHTLMDFLPGTIMTISVAIVMTAVRAPIFLAFFAVLVPLSRGFYQLTKRKLETRNKDFRVSIEHMNSYMAEMLRLLPVTRAHHLEDDEIQRADGYLRKIRRAGFHLDSLNAIYGCINWAIVNIFNILTLCLATYLKCSGRLDLGIGDIILVTGYFSTISNCVAGFLAIMPGIYRSLESIRSIGDVLECDDLEHNENKNAVMQVNGEFSFEHVDFQYEPGPDWQLKDFSLHVKPGETIALVGPSGAGKSTLVQLVIGFIRPQRGIVRLDGTDMSDLDLRTYRQYISVVTQETILFDGTIRQNITYGRPNTSEDAIRQAIHDASLDDLIAELPMGLDTPIHENGERLSGGQRQRLAIARALLRNPRVLLLDEATSALDVDSEGEIKTALDRLMKGRTTFVVAHRLSTIQNADRIVVIEHGSIDEIGNHQELLARNGKYAEMYRKFTNQK